MLELKLQLDLTPQIDFSESEPVVPAAWAAAQCTLHSDASDADNLTISDTDKVDAWVNDGTTMTAWAGSATARPAYSATSLNTRPGITFDGSNDQLTNALRANQVFGGYAGTLAMIVQVVALPGAGAKRDVASFPEQGYGAMIVGNTAGQGRFAMELGLQSPPSRNISAGVPYLLLWRCDGANQHLSVNGGTESDVAGSDPGGQTNTLLLGGDGGNNGFSNVIIGEIWVKSTQCSVDDIASLLLYCQQKWGIS